MFEENTVNGNTEYIAQQPRKKKYIYAIHPDANTVAIERYTIIYSNDQYIYFKEPGCKALGYVRPNSIRTFSECIKYFIARDFNISITLYTDSIPSNYKDILEDLNNNGVARKIVALENEIEKYSKDQKRLLDSYKYNEQRIESLTEEVKKLKMQSCLYNPKGE